MNILFKKLIFLVLLYSSYVCAISSEEAKSYSFLLDICNANAEFSASYAKWVGDTRSIVDENIKKYPKNAVKIEQQFDSLNEKSKDILFEQLRSTIRSRNNSDVNALIKSTQDIVMFNAETIGKLYPSMSKTFYQRKLEESCRNDVGQIIKKSYE